MLLEAGMTLHGTHSTCRRRMKGNGSVSTISTTIIIYGGHFDSELSRKMAETEYTLESPEAFISSTGIVGRAYRYERGRQREYISTFIWSAEIDVYFTQKRTKYEQQWL